LVLTGKLDSTYLTLLSKPAKYSGAEINSVKKDISKVSLTFGLAFPDAYEVGMSHLGMQILYNVMNAMPDVACERVFSPWKDAEALLRERGLALTTLENKIALNSLDVLGISLQYELSYTNVLNMLELGGVPLFSSERSDKDPIVIGGGPGAFNPEPVAEFFDCFLIGDGELAVPEICTALIESKKQKLGRKETLRRLTSIKGVYVPSFFTVEYNSDSTIRSVTPVYDDYKEVSRRVEPDLNKLPFPEAPVVPFVQAVHDRLSVEIARGCTRGCRFCQAGMIYRPARERDIEKITAYVERALKKTGYEEASLLSLSTGDYTRVNELLGCLMRNFEGSRISVSLPSMRVGTLDARLAAEIKKVRKTGFTLAPEAGTERLRSVINKGIEESALIAGARDIFSLGWRSLKLYFMIGMPTETKKDVEAIITLSRKTMEEGRAFLKKLPDVNVSAAAFVPKPFTPFQWEPQATLEYSKEMLNFLREGAKRNKLGFKWHAPEMSILEGVFARGDRRLSKLVLLAFKKGARFDGWTEEFNWQLWKDAMAKAHVDADFYTTRKRSLDEVLPWDHLKSGIDKKFLIEECESAFSAAATPDCKVGRCSDCGVCDFRVIKNVTASISASEEALGGKHALPKDAPNTRVRLRFSKTGDVRLISHLEMMNVFLRALRRIDAPLAYSKGFHPHPRVSFATPLSVGVESDDEYVDMELISSIDFDEESFKLRVNEALPEGIKILSSEIIGLQLPPLSAIIKKQDFTVDLGKAPFGLFIDLDRVDGFLRAFKEKRGTELAARVERKGMVMTVDMLPLLEDVYFEGGVLGFGLIKRETAGIKPHEALAHVLSITPKEASLIPVRKTRTVF